MPPRHPTPRLPVAAMLAPDRLAFGFVTCGLLAIGLLTCGGLALAATPHKPRHTQPAPAASVPPAPSSRDVEPETTATIPTRAIPRAPDAAGTKDHDTLPAPFHLPTASRARMRDCGLKWQAMKMSGAAGDDIWRDFATRCLAAANGPLDKR